MIQLYPKGTSDFTKNGIELMPSESEVNWQKAGRYDFTMNIPREACEGIAFDYGQILKVSVPPQIVGPISLGTVSYYVTTESTKLYSQVPTLERIYYSQWIGYTVTEGIHQYAVGAKVTYLGQNYQCNTWIEGNPIAMVPPNNSSWWTAISNTIGQAGKEIATLASGTSIMKVSDFNSTYIEAATLDGKQGYILAAAVQATGTSEERIIPQFEITEQLFTIKKIHKETSEHIIQIDAEHYSYMLGRTMLGECSVVGVNPATALLFIKGAMNENYPGDLYTNVNSGTIDGDWSWKNAQAAILDPSSGLLKCIDADAIRDNLDVYIVPTTAEDASYEIAYGVNMESVRWDGDVGNIRTRIYPIAQREDGTRITLPEKYIDTVRTVPYVVPETLDTKLKIGQKVKNSDGTEVELTETEVYTRMRQMGQDRFDIDHCDMAEVSLELDYVHMPDTVEYKPYLNLRNMAPLAWVRVENGPMGIDTVIQLTGYKWDPILLHYQNTTFGDKKQKASVAGYDLKSGSVSGRALASGAVTGANIAAGTITAREIEANSITAEQIASKVITSALIAAGAITADEISTTDLTAIQAKLQIAQIADAEIGSANIGYAQIKDASVQNLIARDALTDRYFIDKLQVRNMQAVAATVGELVVKAADNKYYKLNVGTDGSLSATEVTLTAAEITAGVTSDGHGTIIETDLTAQDLAATNIKGINALIDKLNAARINVDELFARTAFINKLNTTNIESTANLKIKAGGTFTVDSGNFSIDSSGNVSMTGTINAGAGGTIAGWDINAASLTGNKTGIAKTTNDADIAFWAGNATAGSANFRVTQGGKVTLRDLVVLDEQGNETTVDLRNYPLWKLSYSTIKTFTKSESGNSITLTIGTSDGDKSVTFSKAALTAHLVGSWSGNTYTVIADNDPNVLSVSTTVSFSPTSNTIDTFSNHLAYATVSAPGVTGPLKMWTIDTSGEYSAGETAGWNTGYDAARAYVSMPGAGTGTSFTVEVPNAARTGAETHTFTITKGTPSASGGYAAVSYNNGAVCRISLSDWWTGGANSVTVSAAGWQNGANRVSASNGEYVDVSLPSFTASQDNSFTSHKKNVYFYTASVTGPLKTEEVDATSEYNAGVTAGNTAGYNSAKLSGSFSGAIWTVTKGTTGTDSVSLTLSATASISYDSTTHKYTATGKARASNADRASATATSGTEAYDAGVTAGNTAGYNSAKLSGSFSGAVWTVTMGTTGTDSVSLTLSATASISYDSTTHKYTATGKARANNADRASATATSGTEAYDAGSTAGWTGCYYTVGLDSTTETTLSYGASVTVYAQAKSSSGASSKTNVASRKIIAPADRYTTGYNAGKLDGIASVTISSVEQQGAITYSGGNYSVPVKATASNSETGSGTITFSGSEAYKAGNNTSSPSPAR